MKNHVSKKREETVHVVWHCLIRHPLQTNPWPTRSRCLVDSCHVLNALPSSTKTATAELRLNFPPIFLLCLSNHPPNFPVRLFLLFCCTLQKDPLLLVQNPLQIFCYPRFVVREDSDMFRGYHRFNTKWNIRGNDISWFIKTGTYLIKYFPVIAIKTPLQADNTALGPVIHGFHHVLHALNDRLVHRGQKHTCGQLIQGGVMQGTWTRQALCQNTSQLSCWNEWDRWHTDGTFSKFYSESNC